MNAGRSRPQHQPNAYFADDPAYCGYCQRRGTGDRRDLEDASKIGVPKKTISGCQLVKSPQPSGQSDENEEP